MAATRQGYDLADVADYNAILRHRAKVQLRPSMQEYCRAMYYVQQLRRCKWFVFALCMTLCIEFQIRAIFPSDFELQAVLALGLAIVVIASICGLEHVALTYAGDPSDCLSGVTHDEEMAMVANEVKQLIKDILPANVGARVSIENIFTSVSDQKGKGHTTVTATSAAATAAAAAAAVPQPLVQLNMAAPRPSIVIPHGPPQKPNPQIRSLAANQKVRSSLMSFNPSLRDKGQ